MIPDAAQTLIETWPLGFIATADAAGMPNVSPKGTFQVIDAHTLGFAEMRSPNTVTNLGVRPEVEVNFIDVLSRKGVRVRGMARVHNRGTAPFDQHYDRFAGAFPDLADMINAIVLIDVETCRPLASPIYEIGADETATRAAYFEKIRGQAAPTQR